jgi:hypothetical protein
MSGWIEITTNVGCPNNCEYCPQEVFLKSYGAVSSKYLSIDVFNTFLSRIPKSVSIVFSGFSEPFLNKKCTDMILLAHERGFKVVVFTSLLGLEHSQIERISNIHFERFFVHFPRTSNIKYFNEEFIQLYNHLRTNMPVIPAVVGNSDFLMKDVHLKEVLGLANLVTMPLLTRAGNLGNLCKVQKSTFNRCKYGILGVLLPNGDVVRCCMDWKLEYILGHVNNFQVNYHIGRMEFPICKNCEWSEKS